MKKICRPNNRKRKNFKLRWQNQYGLLCAYCANPCTECATIDHLIPLSRGGDNRLENLVMACRACNELKGDLLVEEFQPLKLKPIQREVTDVY